MNWEKEVKDGKRFQFGENWDNFLSNLDDAKSTIAAQRLPSMSLIKSIPFNSLGDDRGQLISLESHKNIPIDIKRVYYMYNTTTGVRRGLHAHKKLEQVLVCISGSCTVLLDDGQKKQIIKLDSPAKGLYVGILMWHEMYDFSTGCVLMVLASDYYNECDYIRDYDKFVEVLSHV